MAFSVRELITGKAAPICVSLSDEVSKALEIMVEHDFSQLPVIDEKSVPIGLITSDSVMTAIRSFGLKFTQLRVKDAYERPNTCDIGDDIFELLIRFHNTSAILWINQKGDYGCRIVEWQRDKFNSQQTKLLPFERQKPRLVMCAS